MNNQRSQTLKLSQSCTCDISELLYVSRVVQVSCVRLSSDIKILSCKRTLVKVAYPSLFVFQLRIVPSCTHKLFEICLLKPLIEFDNCKKIHINSSSNV
jgi:hypothetical protein